MAYSVKFDETYEPWQRARYEAIIRYYPKNFFNEKRLLEVGCGFGHLGKKFKELGCDVTFVDGRVENIEGMRKMIPECASKSYVWDLNKGLGTSEHFDIILHTGLLYHLEDYKQPITDACAQCSHLILETEVCDSAYSICLYPEEDVTVTDQSLTGRGCRPSPSAVEEELRKNNFSFERCFDIDSTDRHHYNWSPQNNGSAPHGQRAMWFCRQNNIIK